MPTQMRVLYCHCAHAEILPKEVKEAVLKKLCQADIVFETTADLCEMSARKDPALKRWTEGGKIKIAACYPRAVKWLFAAAQAPLGMDSSEVLNMRVQSAEEVASALLAAELRPNLPGAQAASLPESTLSLRPAHLEAQTAQPGQWLPWFPVIDFDRCTQCMQCLSFCLFGVFGVDTQRRIEVQMPENCKTNCPACSRVCPEAAIIFPKYKTGPINGEAVSEAEVQREKIKIDVSALLGGDIYQMLRERSERAQSRFSKERDANKALHERQKCLAKLVQAADIPPEVLRALPSPEEIQRKAQEAMAKAQAALQNAHTTSDQ